MVHPRQRINPRPAFPSRSRRPASYQRYHLESIRLEERHEGVEILERDRRNQGQHPRVLQGDTRDRKEARTSFRETSGKQGWPECPGGGKQRPNHIKQGRERTYHPLVNSR